MLASNNIKKFALIGTSCSGKTTLCYQILARLKVMGVSCDGVLQQDRRFAFDRDQLEKYEEAQYYFICNQIMRETELTLRGHAEVLVSDRSVLDLYAYHVAMYGKDAGLEGLVQGWLNTYTRLYYMKPMPYVDDKQRPDDGFRMKVDKCLLAIDVKDHLKVSVIDREKVFENIIGHIGHRLVYTDLNIIASILEMPVLIGGSYAFNRATKFSDIDVYVPVRISADENPRGKEIVLAKKIESMLGVKVDVHLVPNNEVWDYLKGQGFKLYGEEYAKL